MSAMSEATELLRAVESIQEMDPFREKTTRVLEILKAALDRPLEAEKALSIIAASGLLIGEAPRVIDETGVRDELLAEGLIASEAVVGGGHIYEMTVQGDQYVKRVLVDLFKANREETCS